MTNEYQKHIVSTEKEVVFLHRCSQDCLDSILREGLATGGDIRGTATSQPSRLTDAIWTYRSGAVYGDKVAVLKFPRALWENARKKAKGNEVATEEIGYFHPVRRTFTVRPEFVNGWIDRETDEYHPNPCHDRKPVEGHEEFDYMFA